MSRKGNQLYSFRRCDVIFWLSASKLDKLISYNIVASLWIDNTRIWERYAQSQRAHLARPFPIWELTRYIHSISQSKRNAHKCKKKKSSYETVPRCWRLTRDLTSCIWRNCSVRGTCSAFTVQTSARKQAEKHMSQKTGYSWTCGPQTVATRPWACERLPLIKHIMYAQVSMQQ